MINITTFENSLKTSGNRYCFRSVTDQTLDSELLIKEIINYNSTITEADARAMLSVLNDRVKHFVALGYKVELPFGYVFLKANGTVPKLNDAFVPGTKDHRLSACCVLKEDAAKEMENSTAYRISGTGWTILPKITEITSMDNAGAESEFLNFHASDILRAKGKNLGFDYSDQKQGVFFVGADGTEKRASRYHNIGTAIIDVYVPENLAQGTYKVKVATSPRKECLEVFTFASEIEVA